MGATGRPPPRRLGVRGGLALQLAHRENRSENSLLVYPGAAFPADPLQGFAMLPQRDRGVREGSIRDLQVVPPGGVEDVDAAKVEGIAPDQKLVAPIPLRDPGLERVAVVDDVVEHEAVPLNGAALDRKEVDQERLGV